MMVSPGVLMARGANTRCPLGQFFVRSDVNSLGRLSNP